MVPLAENFVNRLREIRILPPPGERGAVERIVHALHTGFIAVVEGGHAGQRATKSGKTAIKRFLPSAYASSESVVARRSARMGERFFFAREHIDSPAAGRASRAG